ncbi:fasciclin domain-containing protein [Leptobacterium flavescens]|uniref:Fasciclin domain-containing protein n=1 Tax=Leptobacterium flavescens TaxID=472055 RepID=A0A6P0UQE5_9FLAO|nr:fasciclin domain-containing protein [Leptobacterium flavescens]NER14700.1 fasciclin domain-containing protein [Leptobacterium flavescens]
MKTLIQSFIVFALILLLTGCKNKTEQVVTASEPEKEELQEKQGQAFIKDDESRPNVLQIAIGSPDHSTLVAAVQAAQLENSLVNAGPLTVFAPTNEAFEALPAGTVENLLKPENKEALANILKYHVTPGNLKKDFLKRFKKLGQANNQDVQVKVEEGEPLIGGAKIIASVDAGNGIVHIIDKVLLPPEN